MKNKKFFYFANVIGLLTSISIIPSIISTITINNVKLNWESSSTNVSASFFVKGSEISGTFDYISEEGYALIQLDHEFKGINPTFKEDIQFYKDGPTYKLIYIGVEDPICSNNTDIKGLVTFPNSIMSINGFSNCPNISSVVFGNNLIESRGMFINNSSLEYIKFGSSVLNKLGDGSFYNCTNLKTLVFSWTGDKIKEQAEKGTFNDFLDNVVGSTKKSQVTVYVPKGEKQNYINNETALGIHACKEITDGTEPKPTPAPTPVSGQLPLILGLSLGLGIPALVGVITGTVLGIKKHNSNSHKKSNKKK